MNARKAVLADLQNRRIIFVEAKVLRARLAQLIALRAEFTNAAIAKRYGVSTRYVQSVASSIPWLPEEKKPAEKR